jgi:hypothetical protein
VRAYDPDVVLLAFYAGNDIRNNSPRLETYRVRPFFHIEDGQLALDAGFRRHPDFLKAKSSWVRAKVAVINRSRLLQLLNELWNRIRMRTPKPDAVSGVEDSEVFLPPADENWRDAWAITERIIQQLNAEVTQCGSAFVLVAVTLDIQVHPDASVREQFRKDIGASDLTYPDQRLGALGERCGFPVILLSEAMRRYAEQSRQPLHGFPNSGLGVGHWNATGHHLAARLIAEAMSQAPAGTWDHANAGPHLTIWQDEDGPWSVPAISYGTSSSVSSLWEAWRMARTKTMSGRIVNTARCVERPPRP